MKRQVTENDVASRGMRVFLRAWIYGVHEAVGRIQKQKVHGDDVFDRVPGDISPFQRDKGSASRSCICRLDGAGFSLCRTLRHNLFQREPGRKEAFFHMSRHSRSHRPQALFIKVC